MTTPRITPTEVAALLAASAAANEFDRYLAHFEATVPQDEER